MSLIEGWEEGGRAKSTPTYCVRSVGYLEINKGFSKCGLEPQQAPYSRGCLAELCTTQDSVPRGLRSHREGKGKVTQLV